MEKFDQWEKQMFEEAADEAKGQPYNPSAGLNKIAAVWMNRQKAREKEVTREIFFVTINPNNARKFQDFRNCVEGHLVPRGFMKGAFFCYEQRSKELDQYHGYHVHIIMNKTMSPKQLHDRLSSTFKLWIGSPKCIDIRTYPASYFEEKLDYFKGRKWDETKDDSVRVTVEWREKEGIDIYYSVDEWLKEIRNT